jgi:molecular chaperone GrpE
MSDELQNQNEEVVVQAATPAETDWHAVSQRAQADYVNLQKEVAADRMRMGAFATAQAVQNFLPVYDYFKRAMAHVPTEEQSPAWKQWMVGTMHIANLFKTTLTQLGVTEMETVGAPFDPAKMEAVKEEYKEGVAAGTVIAEVEGGYEMNQKIIKAARVIIAAEKTNE